MERFWSKVRKSEHCWIWTASFNGLYGQFWYNGKVELAHRASWLIHFGSIPEGLNVLHSCDNPPCVNPGHLLTGLQIDNIRDMDSKGRRGDSSRQGIRNGRSILVDDDVREIRAASYSGETHSEIASRYGMSEAQVGFVVRKQAWKHVT